ncbi:hypothetical protein [Bacillus mesophilum]|uniref:Uncharacterized protein n=1 Tax=Bacillus mesophilum TaxID=1071718 RepID=A0A7V7RML4_9BACI|nr:hypothetical protein [Bacillus mesophilum]KAB2333582.1 hypothetical protein F7732_05680 [Bacillus mesophilum]
MRLFLDTKKYTRNIQQIDIEILNKVLSSGYFVFLDLIFWSFLLTMLTFEAHGSIFIGFIIFVSSYVFGVILYSLLNLWLKEQPGD